MKGIEGRYLYSCLIDLLKVYRSAKSRINNWKYVIASGIELLVGNKGITKNHA